MAGGRSDGDGGCCWRSVWGEPCSNDRSRAVSVSGRAVRGAVAQFAVRKTKPAMSMLSVSLPAVLVGCCCYFFFYLWSSFTFLTQGESGGGVAATFRRQQLQLQLQHHQQQHPQQHPQTEMMAVGGRTSIDISRSRAVLPAVVLVFWPRWWRYRQPCNLQPDATDPRPDDKKRRGCRT